MKIPKRKKQKNEELDDADDNRPVRFDALAELTSSEVVEQVKMGMSRLTPLGESDELETELTFLDDAPAEEEEEAA